MERGINARIADRMVWQGIIGLITSPDRMLAEMDRWRKNRKDKIKASGIDIDTIQKNITKLKEQVDRYNNAYGAGLFSLEKLKNKKKVILMLLRCRLKIR